MYSITLPFQWIKDIGQRRMMMIWLISFKSDLSLKARLVVNGKMCIDYDPDETYRGNVAATSTKIFFALSALYGLTLLNNGTPDCKKIYCILRVPRI